MSISVITIKGTDCRLVELGKMADKTGGQVSEIYNVLTYLIILLFDELQHEKTGRQCF